MNNPSISVCIPTYNQSDFLEQSILSAFNQTLKPHEIIIFNDASTDNTKAVLDELKTKINILKVIHQPENLGIARNVDMCLRSAEGKYIVRLDSDDVLLPRYLEVLSDLLDRFEFAGYAHAAVQEIDKDNISQRKRSLFRKDGFQDGEQAFRESLKGYKVAANIIMFRRTSLEEVGFIKSKVDFAEDYYLSAALAEMGWGNVYISKVLSNYRVWVDQVFVRQKRKMAEIVGLRKVFEEILEPGWSKRGWNMKLIQSQRAHLAINHASCLKNELYTKKEKEELINELYNLSKTNRTKMALFMYRNGFGNIILVYNSILGKIKSLAKLILSSIKA